MRRTGGVAAAAAALLLLVPAQSRAGQIPSQLIVTAAISTTSGPTYAFTSVFDGAGHGIHEGSSNTVTTNVFHMSVSADYCCTVHAFVLGPWYGTWTLSGGSDTLSGTATGTIDAACFALGFDCITPNWIGPGVSMTLTITGGTGRYANATGSGSLTGEQTLQVFDPTPIPPAVFVGLLKLSVA